MTNSIRPPLVAVLAFVAASCSDSTGPQTVETEWSGTLDQGQTIEIKGINGGIFATSASGNDVIVNATKEGGNNDPTEVEVEVVVHSGGVTICAVYPDVPGEPPNECAPGTEGRMNTRDNDVEVTFWVEVPAGIDFVGSTVNGTVNGTDLQSNACASTVNGDVSFSTSQLATATTVNGSIDASIGLTDWDFDLVYTAVNGNISARVPTGTNADVHLRTVNGSITADLPLTIVSPGDVRGVLGTGGRTLALTTVNGNLELVSGS